MKRKNQPVRLSVGGSLILVVFVALCLITFAVLSLAGANANARTSRQTLERAAAYDQASNEAEERLGEIDLCLKQAEERAGTGGFLAEAEQALLQLDGVQVSWEGEALTAAYQVTISDTQRLDVSLRVNEAGSDTYYTLTGWQTVSTVDWEAEPPYQLWQE